MLIQFFKSYFIQLILIFGLGIGAYKHTSNDWDQLSYAACILTYSISDSVKIHDSVYRLANNYYYNENGEAYHEMVSKNLYRLSTSSFPKSFFQQLPFYKVKPFYIWLGYLISKLGFDPIQALKILNFICFGFIGFILARFLSTIFSWIPSLLLFTALISYNGLMDMVKELTPDVLSFLILILISISYLRSKNYLFIFILSALAILCRPDNLIFCVLIQFGLVALHYKNLKSLTNPIIQIASYLLIYFIVQNSSSAYSWHILFYHTFIDLVSYPADSGISIEFKTYIKYVLKGIDNLIPFLAILSFIILILRECKREFYLFIIVLGTIISKFILFPAISERFYLVYGYIICLGLLEIYKNYKENSKNISVN